MENIVNFPLLHSYVTMDTCYKEKEMLFVSHQEAGIKKYQYALVIILINFRLFLKVTSTHA